MDWMDKDKSGTLTFDEFLIGLRGGLNETRMEYVRKAFDKFDKNDSGSVTVADLVGVYQVVSEEATF